MQTSHHAPSHKASGTPKRATAHAKTSDTAERSGGASARKQSPVVKKPVTDKVEAAADTVKKTVRSAAKRVGQTAARTRSKVEAAGEKAGEKATRTGRKMATQARRSAKTATTAVETAATGVKRKAAARTRTKPTHRKEPSALDKVKSFVGAAVDQVSEAGSQVVDALRGETHESHGARK